MVSKECKRSDCKEHDGEEVSKQAEKQVRHRATTMIIYQRQLFYIGSLPNLTLMIDMLMNHSTCNPPEDHFSSSKQGTTIQNGRSQDNTNQPLIGRKHV